MKKILLRDFYELPLTDKLLLADEGVGFWATEVEIKDTIAEELFRGADKLENQLKVEKQRWRRHKEVYLDMDIEDDPHYRDALEVTVRSVRYPEWQPEPMLAKKEQRRCLCCALNALPEKQRVRWKAHHMDGMSSKEIATVDKVSVSMVNQSILEAEKKMPALYMRFEKYTAKDCTHCNAKCKLL